jgi:hypothetical protein
MITEEWRPVPRYEGLYDVSDFGNVRSLDRIVFRQGVPCKIKGQPKRPARNACGDSIMLSANDERESVSIGKLVAMAFLNAPADASVVHRDGNIRNNHVGNLIVTTRKGAGHIGQQRMKATRRPYVVSDDSAEYRTIECCKAYEISATKDVRRKAGQFKGHHCMRELPARVIQPTYRGNSAVIRMSADGVSLCRSLNQLFAEAWPELK